MPKNEIYLLGYDVGSSSVKAALIQASSGKLKASALSPKKELDIIAHHPGWAEQDPETWWKHIKSATAELLRKAKINPTQIQAIGVSYQMHGLVMVDRHLKVLRPSLIWCDSRAVETGEKAFREIGEKKCLEQFLNSPGNFTASKLKWIKDNEPEIYKKTYKIMLPGDFIIMKMTNQVQTTISGLSEGILWNYKEKKLNKILLDYYGISENLIPEIVPTFSIQGKLSPEAAKALGLKAGTLISYRAGDQPNNAFSLNVLNSGEIAATAGTSGVIYGLSDQPVYDTKSRVNTFVHVNHTEKKPRYGVLLCVNGTGIMNSWMRKILSVKAPVSYPEMNALAAKAPIGSDGLLFYPYGNGAERTLGNRHCSAGLTGLQSNIHNPAHLVRSVQEGIVFALNYGLNIMQDMGLEAKVIRAGRTNMFLSSVFCEAFAGVTGAAIELYDTEGAQGAARGAGLGAGIYNDPKEAFIGMRRIKVIEPEKKLTDQYREFYAKWQEGLSPL